VVLFSEIRPLEEVKSLSEELQMILSDGNNSRKLSRLGARQSNLRFVNESSRRAAEVPPDIWLLFALFSFGQEFPIPDGTSALRDRLAEISLYE
jgi:hypothetical protein